MCKRLLWIASIAVIAFKVPEANAAMFSWSFASTNLAVYGSGTLDATLVGSFDGSTEYSVTQVFGTTDGVSISGILPIGTFGCDLGISGCSYAGSPPGPPPSGLVPPSGLPDNGLNDNLIYYPDYPPENGSFVDRNGLSYALTNGVYINLSAYERDVLVSYSEPGGEGANDVPTWTLTLIPTPLPAALPLFAGGLGALGLLGWRRKRKAAAQVAA